MKITAVVEALVVSGASPETILAAVRAIESQQVDALEKRREADRNRQAKRRSVTLGHVTSERSRSRVRVEDSSSNSEINEGRKKEDSRAPAAPSPRDELEIVLDARRADAVVAHRKGLRKPLTAHAAKLLAGKFAKCDDPNAAADAMIAAGWQGFEPEWLEGRNKPRGPGPPGGLGKLTPWQRQMQAFDEVFDERSDERSTTGTILSLPGTGTDGQ